MQLRKLVDGQIILPSTMLKDVLVVTSTSTTCLGLRALGKSTYYILTLKMQYKAPGPHSSTALKLMLMNAYRDKSVICMCRSMSSRTVLHDMKKSYCNAEGALTKEHSHVKDLEQELKDLKSHLQSEVNTSVLLPVTMVTAGPTPWVVVPALSLPQSEAGPSCLLPPQPEARPSSRNETRPASLPEEVNLGSHIAMEVDNEYDWLTEEASFKLVDGPLPVSNRPQRKGLGPSVYILSFNSIEALEKSYLAQSPSRLLSDPTFRQKREGVLNRIAVDHIMMKNRVLGPALSIELPPPGETSVRFPWRPVLEHLASLPGIGEPLTVGDPSLSQTGQLPHPLGQTSLRKAQWFNLCPMMDPFFKETVEVMKEISPMWHTWDMHTIMQ